MIGFYERVSNDLFNGTIVASKLANFLYVCRSIVCGHSSLDSRHAYEKKNRLESQRNVLVSLDGSFLPLAKNEPNRNWIEDCHKVGKKSALYSFNQIHSA